MGKLYTKAGVNIEAGIETVDRIKGKVKSTHTASVLTGLGSFGALYDLKKIFKEYKEPVLVQSIDGVGTKLLIAEAMQKFDTVGQDIVNHSCNDILAMGAKPITFLDYVANERLEPKVMEKIVEGMVLACKENGVALIGGETAEMPGVYIKDKHDIAGCITGVVEKSKIITGEKIRAGNKIFGFASNGLHTNGFSLARKILFKKAKLNVKSKVKGLSKTLGEALLAPHLNYTNPIHALLKAKVDILGIAHLTGGGFIDNIPRVLPGDCDALIKRESFPILPIFKIMQEIGKVPENEMFQVFNMGIGLVFVVPSGEENKIKKVLGRFANYKFYEIGEIIKGNGKVILN